MEKAQFLRQFQRLGSFTQEPDFPLREAGKPAAVLMPIVERPEGLTMLFTQRAKHLKHHAGQISFPGGKQEPQDRNLIETALRESEEEIGLDPNLIEIVGQLPRYRTISRFEVLPIVAFVQGDLVINLDPNEVDNCFEVPLAHLLSPDNHLIYWATRNQRQWPLYFIPWQDKTIWGATAAFVRNLSNICHLP